MWELVNGWSKEWTTELGILVRQHAPFYKNWKHIPKATKEYIYKCIKDKCKMRYEDPHVMRCIDKQLQKQLKDYRCRLHKHFLKFSLKEVHCHPYKCVTQETWDLVCNRFISEKFKRQSETNKKNRKENKVPHRGGSKSFIRYREELRDLETQQLLGRIQFFEKTYFKPGKCWSCLRFQELHEKMVAQLQESQLDGDDSSMIEDHIVDELLSISTYVGGLGHGMVGPSSNTSLREQVLVANKRNAILESEIEALRRDAMEKNTLLELETEKAYREASDAKREAAKAVEQCNKMEKMYKIIMEKLNCTN